MIGQILASLLALLPALVTVAGLRVASRREGPFPTETAAEIAWREGRQCTTALLPLRGLPGPLRLPRAPLRALRALTATPSPLDPTPPPSGGTP